MQYSYVRAKSILDKVNIKNLDLTKTKNSEITELENEISVNLNDLDKAKAERIIMRYRDYVNVNPRDSISAEYLFKAADLSVGIGKPEAAVKFLDRLNTDFPDFRKTVEMWLFKGFIYETYINNHAMAVETYKELIKRYPNHRLAADAQASINNLSMSEDELIEKYGLRVISTDGDAKSGWIAMDYGSLIVHVMSSKMRRFYKLEGRWKDAEPVNLSSILIPESGDFDSNSMANDGELSMRQPEEEEAEKEEEDPFWK